MILIAEIFFYIFPQASQTYPLIHVHGDATKFAKEGIKKIIYDILL